METKLNYFLKFSIGLIALLWFYAAASKLMNFEHFKEAMQKQPLSTGLKQILTYGLLPFEIALGTLLLTDKLVRTGLFLSAASFLLFFLYSALILSKVFGGIPCACGGLIERMGWTFHLWFNLGFFALTLTTIIIHIKRKEHIGKQR